MILSPSIQSNIQHLETEYRNIHKDIIDRCRVGDRQAQFQLYKLYYKAMYNTSLRILGHEGEAEDVMQDSFLAAFQKLSTFKAESTFGAWLKRIVINKSINALKARKNVESMEMHDDLESKEEIIDEPFELIEDIDIPIIKASIDKLPDGYRMIINLYLIEGYDHEEIAEILNITSSTSRSQFNRAKNKLKTILKEIQ